MTPIQKIALAEKYRSMFEKQAKENKQVAADKMNNTFSENLPKTIDNPIDTRKELAKIAGVSDRTYDKGRKILESNNEVVKQEVLTGKKSIDAAYKEINPPKPTSNPKQLVQVKETARICTCCDSEKPIVDFFGDDKVCKDCKRKSLDTQQESQGGGAFKNVATGELIKSNTIGLDEDILAEIKTEKNAFDYVVPEREIEWKFASLNNI
ncbi:hypothetical protein KCX82_14140 [Clostridiales bacterium BAD-6]|uniref:Uncharacterized protein n=1 Tax=Sinanaerobacter chloroacetimidivorans TaxID=2818044 RepID=A0A8J7W4H1_9FIRM|nr:hypothetical protein [Sinanaerobacter chloroacetimidivorans]